MFSYFRDFIINDVITWETEGVGGVIFDGAGSKKVDKRWNDQF